MQTPRDPSMEDILASIKRVIAEEKELRAAVPPASPPGEDREEDVLDVAGHGAKTTVAAGGFARRSE